MWCQKFAVFVCFARVHMAMFMCTAFVCFWAVSIVFAHAAGVLMYTLRALFCLARHAFAFACLRALSLFAPFPRDCSDRCGVWFLLLYIFVGVLYPSHCRDCGGTCPSARHVFAHDGYHYEDTLTTTTMNR